LTYRITFAVTGRARFLSHLETVDTLLSALRRAGNDIALSQGMKPRPVISLAMPRAVGVESEGDLADVQLVADPEPAVLAGDLAARLPEGMRVVTVERRAPGRRAAARVRRVEYRVDVADDVDWEAALAAFETATEAVAVRTAPGKPDRRVDVKQFCHSIEYEPGRFALDLELTEGGTARPEEVIHAVAATIGATATIERLVRTAITLAAEPVGVET
jgi:radical SAM-linked protein